jgi:hypothetical protein
VALTSLGEAMSQRVVLTDHAIAEARRRGISEGTILKVANTPEQRLAVQPNREVRQSRVTDPASGKLQLIRVVVDRGKDGDTVVTVYRTSKVGKYWRDE